MKQIGSRVVKIQREIRRILADLIKTAGILLAATLIGLLFFRWGFTESNIITVYILGVLIVSVVTSRWIYSLAASGISVLVFNFLFTMPRFTLMAYDRGYPVTFLIMFLSSLITGSMAAGMKRNAREKENAAVMVKNEQLKANLLRGISHDLRTPLTSIMGNASNLLSNGSMFDEETRKQIYGDIYDESLWLVNLVENLLSASRMESGAVKLNISTELVEEVVAEALRHTDRRREEHTIQVEGEDELLLAKMDPKLIVQVIINLVDNAVKYTPPGSEIYIRFGREDAWAWIQVEDNGPGIPDETKDQIFEMFYTGGKYSADSRRSLGIGLALCRLIVNAHGGTIQVRDHQPHGACFRFTLPLGEVELHEQ